MQLNQLRYFWQVAEMGSFSRASVHLRVTQPALSRQVRLLEEELGVQLLYRDGRGARLTDAGRDLFDRSIKLFRELDEIKEAIVARGKAIEGEVTIGVPPSVGTVLVPQTLMACRDRYPALSVKVIESSSIAVLEEWLIAGQIDLAVVNGAAPVSRSLRLVRLLSEKLFLVGRADSPVARAEGQPLPEVVELPLVLARPPHGIRMLLESACAEQGLTVRPRFEVDSVAVMKELVALGAGFTVLPFTVIRREVEEGRFSAAEVVAPVIRRELLVATPGNRPPLPRVQAVEQLLCEEALTLRTTFGVPCDARRAAQVSLAAG